MGFEEYTFHQSSEYVCRVSEEVAQPNLKMDKRLVFPKEDAQRTF